MTSKATAGSEAPGQPQQLALVTGATGITGRHCVEALLKRSKQWRVLTLARRDLQGVGKGEEAAVHQVKADLLDRGSVEEALKQAGGAAITHIFHCAYIMKQEPGEECEVNARMLRHVVEGAEAVGARLSHVFCMEGGKWYGQQLHTTLKTPHREDDPPIWPPMFYLDLQRYLEERVAGGAPWTWSALRPDPVCGFSTGSFMNLTTSLAVYASICKELGLPLRFPGTHAAYTALCDVCDAGLLAEAMVHCATTPACANQAFNISNGDTFRWQEIWPKIAAFFDMPVAPPVHVPLVKLMADKAAVWQHIAKKHGLQDTPYDQLVTWQFADFVLTFPGDWFCTVNKLRRTGFQGMCLDTDAMFADLFTRMRQQKVIP